MDYDFWAIWRMVMINKNKLNGRRPKKIKAMKASLGAVCRGPEKGENVEYVVEIPIETSVQGGKVSISVPIVEECATCGGSACAYRRLHGREHPAYRRPEDLANDIRRVGAFSRAPTFVFVDPRQQQRADDEQENHRDDSPAAAAHELSDHAE